MCIICEDVGVKNEYGCPRLKDVDYDWGVCERKEMCRYVNGTGFCISAARRLQDKFL